MNPNRILIGLVFIVLLLAGGGLSLIAPRNDSADALVVYCAHDSVYAEEILRKFEQETGIPVVIRYDTEATKSLGLVNLLIQEKDHPRCDVFWNNQVLGTVELEQQNLLEPYKGEGYARVPAQYKSPSGAWTGFGARFRVVIVNTDKMPSTQQAVDAAYKTKLDRMAIAKPMYGTTLSHYRVLWHLRGGDNVKAWHRDLRARGIREVSGNATAMNLVAAGTCDLGWTDTDDFYVGKDRGDPVAMLPIRVRKDGDDGEGSTICIPNSVAIIRGTQRLSAAKRLADFLLSAETELTLARSKSRQIPLGPVDDAQLPADVRRMRPWVKSGYDLSTIGNAREECLDWLRAEYLR